MSVAMHDQLLGHFLSPRGSGGCLDCCFVVRPVKLTTTLLVSTLGAVGHHRGHVLDVLLRFTVASAWLRRLFSTMAD